MDKHATPSGFGSQIDAARVRKAKILPQEKTSQAEDLRRMADLLARRDLTPLSLAIADVCLGLALALDRLERIEDAHDKSSGS